MWLGLVTEPVEPYALLTSIAVAEYRFRGPPSIGSARHYWRAGVSRGKLWLYPLLRAPLGRTYVVYQRIDEKRECDTKSSVAYEFDVSTLSYKGYATIRYDGAVSTYLLVMSEPCSGPVCRK